MSNNISEEGVLEAELDDYLEEDAEKTSQAAKLREIAKAKISRQDVQAFQLDKTPFNEWANIKCLPDNNTVDWEQKAASATTYQDAIFLVGRLFLLNKRGKTRKFVDAEKYMPRQCRMELLKAETKHPKSTDAPKGGLAAWRFWVKSRFWYNSQDSRHDVEYFVKNEETNITTKSTEQFLVHQNILYARPIEKYQKELSKYIGKVNTANPELFGTHSLAPMTPLEDIYHLTVEAHVNTDGTHNGRDLTYAKLSKVASSTITKEYVTDFLQLCPTCEPTHEKNRDSINRSVAGRAKTWEQKKQIQEEGTEIPQPTKKAKSSAKRRSQKSKARAKNVAPSQQQINVPQKDGDPEVLQQPLPGYQRDFPYESLQVPWDEYQPESEQKPEPENVEMVAQNEQLFEASVPELEMPSLNASSSPDTQFLLSPSPFPQQQYGYFPAQYEYQPAQQPATMYYQSPRPFFQQPQFGYHAAPYQSAPQEQPMYYQAPQQCAQQQQGFFGAPYQPAPQSQPIYCQAWQQQQHQLAGYQYQYGQQQ